MRRDAPSDPQPDPALRRRLEDAADGLVYSSESDRPFEFFFLPWAEEQAPLTAAAFALRLGTAPGTPVGERGLDDFLARHTHRTDPYDTRAQAVRPRYEQLKSTLEKSLTDVRVFRVGRIEVDCYMVGRDGGGNLAGLKTVAIET